MNSNNFKIKAYHSIRLHPCGWNYRIISEYESIESNRMSNREKLFASIPFIFLTLAVVLKISDKRRKEREGHEVKED